MKTTFIILILLAYQVSGADTLCKAPPLNILLTNDDRIIRTPIKIAAISMCSRPIITANSLIII